jgi:hypothetical protein
MSNYYPPSGDGHQSGSGSAPINCAIPALDSHPAFLAFVPEYATEPPAALSSCK